MNIRLIEHRLKGNLIENLKNKLINIKDKKINAYILIEDENTYIKIIKLIDKIYNFNFNVQYHNNIKRLNLMYENKKYNLTYCNALCKNNSLFNNHCLEIKRCSNSINIKEYYKTL